MCARQTRAPLFVLLLALSLGFAGCFGGKGGGGGGGGGNGGGNNTPAFAIAVADSGNFQQGSRNVTYTIDVTNTGKVQTSGNVQVTVTLPAGESFVSVNGSGGAQGWTFSGGQTVTATRGDSLAPGASFPIFTITVNVSLYATNPQVVTASVSGGGAATANNQDSTAILTHVSILLGRYAFFFSGFDANGAVAVAGSINVDANGNVTGEEDFKDPSVLQKAQAVTGFCQNAQVAATGFCKLTAFGKTSQYDFVLRNSELNARFFEDPADGASNTGSGVLISQIVPPSNALTSASGFNGVFSLEFSGTDTAGARIGVEGNIFTNLGATIVPQGGIPSQADVNDAGALIAPSSATTTNVTGQMTGPVDANGRATATMTICTAVSAGVCDATQRVLTLALYILAPEVPTTGQSGRAFAIDITPVATSKQVLSGQFFWLGNPPPAFDNTSISGPNVFALWGVAAAAPTKSNTSIGIFDATKNTALLDTNNAGTVNNSALPQPPPLAGTITGPIPVAPSGRAVLTTNVGGVVYTYVLYLDAPDDGDMMGTLVAGVADPSVTFGIFTGQGATSNFNNVKIAGTYVISTDTPVLAAVPNGASPLTLTPTGQSSTIFSGTSSVSGVVTGNYSFDSTTGRGTFVASTQKGFFGNSTDAVFYIITPNVMIIMGADQGVTADPMAFIQF